MHSLQTLCFRLSSAIVLVGLLTLCAACDSSPAPLTPTERGNMMQRWRDGKLSEAEVQRLSDLLVQELRGDDAQKRYGALAEAYQLYNAGRLPQPVADTAVEAILAIQADSQQKQAWQSQKLEWQYLILMLERDDRLSAENWKRYQAAGGRTARPGP